MPVVTVRPEAPPREPEIEGMAQAGSAGAGAVGARNGKDAACWAWNNPALPYLVPFDVSPEPVSDLSP